MPDPQTSRTGAIPTAMPTRDGPGGFRPPRRPLRAVPMTRRYGIIAAAAAGELPQRLMRLAPALPVFEQAFSAFARGTPLATAGGPVSVEDLQPGDRLLTQEDGARPITWIGTMVIYPASMAGTRATSGPIRVVADAFGPGRPAHDLVLGPAARLMQPARAGAGAGHEVLVPVADLVDGVSAIRLSPAVPLELFHITLDRHASLRAAGLALESYHPGAMLEVMTDELAQVFLSLFPNLARLSDFGPLAHPQLPLSDGTTDHAA